MNVGLVGPDEVVLETGKGDADVARMEIKAEKLSAEARAEVFESLTTGGAARRSHSAGCVLIPL